MTPVIRFDDVWRSFGNQQVLRGLSFQVSPGGVYALLGRNGSGKTTALRVLLGLCEPDRGSAAVLGHDSQHLPPDLRDRIGYVTEGHVVDGRFGIDEALRFEADTRARFDLALARHTLERLGLPTSKRIGQLSRGQRAQVALAIARGTHPQVLVLDDPAMGLDAVLRREFLEAMIEVSGEDGQAVLFTSHILSDVERVADRVGILSQGSLLVDAAVDDLKRRVQRRFVRLKTGTTLNEWPGLLHQRENGRGLELLLLDFDALRESELRTHVAELSPPVFPSLEELFLELANDLPAPTPPSPEGQTRS